MRKSAPAVLLAFAAALAGALLVLLQALDGGERGQILADNGGRIELVVVSVSSARSSTLRNAELVNRIVNALPPRIRILILAPDREAFSVISNPWPDRVRFVDLPARPRLTIWPQDPFVVIREPGGSRLLASPDFARAEDAEMARALAADLDWPLETGNLAFEGGNIVADEKHVFIGANTIRLNAVEQGRGEPEIAAEFAARFGRETVVVGPVPQPVGHIDMMLTPLGGKRLMLADPGWGARLAAQALEHAPDAVLAFERSCERDFFGRGDIETLTGRDGKALHPPEIAGTTALAVEHSRSIAGDVDRVAAELEKLGFAVARVPYLARRADLSAAPAEGETIRGAPGYPELTYNNVLLESAGESATVYLPTYGWSALDSAAAEAWRDQGYRVVAIPGFAVTAMYGGALRCSVKVLARHTADR